MDLSEAASQGVKGQTNVLHRAEAAPSKTTTALGCGPTSNVGCGSFTAQPRRIGLALSGCTCLHRPRFSEPVADQKGKGGRWAAPKPTDRSQSGARAWQARNNRAHGPNTTGKLGGAWQRVRRAPLSIAVRERRLTSGAANSLTNETSTLRSHCAQATGGGSGREQRGRHRQRHNRLGTHRLPPPAGCLSLAGLPFASRPPEGVWCSANNSSTAQIANFLVGLFYF